MTEARLGEYQRLVSGALEQYFTGREVPYAGLHEAMRYSLLNGGKRIRPALTLEFCRVTGGEAACAVEAACAIELLHTYTLIHDDLPCMDDDELRRGRPASHVVYGEATAVLAGDALQAEAFSALLSARLPPERVLLAAKILARAAGADGVCAGQFLDMLENAAPDTESLFLIHSLKTSALISACAEIGVVCGGGTEAQLHAARRYASSLGAAFQIRDDLLDASASTTELGKPAGSDIKGGKTTFMSLLGEQRCVEIIESLTQKAKEAARSGFEDSAFLCALADMLAGRKS